jgi:hypothetical protein
VEDEDAEYYHEKYFGGESLESLKSAKTGSTFKEVQSCLKPLHG